MKTYSCKNVCINVHCKNVDQKVKTIQTVSDKWQQKITQISTDE